MDVFSNFLVTNFLAKVVQIFSNDSGYFVRNQLPNFILTSGHTGCITVGRLVAFTPDDMGSNPAMSNFTKNIYCYLYTKSKIKKKRPQGLFHKTFFFIIYGKMAINYGIFEIMSKFMVKI